MSDRSDDPHDPGRARRLDRLVRLLAESDRTLGHQFKIGLLIRSFQPAGAGYGSRWVPTVAEEVRRRGGSVSVSLLFRLLKLTAVFTPAQVEELDGKIRWETAMRVLAVEDAAARAAVLRQVAAAHDAGSPLSTRRVREVIRARTGYRRPRGGATPPPPSRNPHDALAALRAVIKRWEAVDAAWAGKGRTALDRASQLPPGQVTDDVLTELAEAAAGTIAVARQAAALAKRLARLLRELKGKAGGRAGPTAGR